MANACDILRHRIAVVCVVSACHHSPALPKRASVYNLLVKHVVPALQRLQWGFLFVAATDQQVFTVLDEDCDPYINHLAAWLHACLHTENDTLPALPVYPSRGDRRPKEKFSLELEPLNKDVWRHFTTSVLPMTCMTCQSGPLRAAYDRSKRRFIPPAEAPMIDERIRQWHRLTVDNDFINFTDIVECLAWPQFLIDEQVLLFEMLDAFLCKRRPYLTQKQWRPFRFFFEQ